MPSRIFQDQLLEGMVALVTGGGTGIGLAIATELGRLGATPILASRKAENVEPAAAGLSAHLGRPVEALVLDIRDREAIGRAIPALVERHGRLDLLVNNGGGQFLAPAETIRPRGWDAVVETNLTGTWNMTRAVADAWMMEHGGRIINITMMVERGFPGMAHSVAARGGVESMSKTLAVEWSRRGILVNCIQPGIIASSGILGYPGGKEFAHGLQREIPLRRLGTTDEIAWMVAFLASPAGAYITGQSFIVDGGRTLWGRTWELLDEGPLPEIEISPPPWEREEEA